ncbi:hypothetical protein EBAPG3_008895 [Nitrosospira lacus]|uniref:Uncharacterized protein n=1 Tax=Nitrosospira lacus TaxID=1288494 RepID=A0A1W6SPY3_9PROT|nr:hypothetical protein EBAPG3_008895 [Nitrosospira lacus]
MIILNAVADRNLTLTCWMSLLPGGLHGSCGTWLRYNALKWGALERRVRGPRSGDRSAQRMAETALMFHACGAPIPLRGRAFLREALLRPALRTHHSASSYLTLHPGNCTLHLVQLPDLG